LLAYKAAFESSERRICSGLRYFAYLLTHAVWVVFSTAVFDFLE
jgi:hypothetical protein